MISWNKLLRSTRLMRSGAIVFLTLSVATHAQQVRFPDRPDVMSRFRVTLSGDPERYPIMLSNGNPGPVQFTSSGSQCISWDDPYRKPCYLFALVAGRFERISEHQ